MYFLVYFVFLFCLVESIGFYPLVFCYITRPATVATESKPNTKVKHATNIWLLEEAVELLLLPLLTLDVGLAADVDLKVMVVVTELEVVVVEAELVAVAEAEAVAVAEPLLAGADPLPLTLKAPEYLKVLGL